jgi:Tfp pilus assembly protein PilN
MIRINLSGKPKQKNRRASSAPAMEFGESSSSFAGNFLVLVVVIGVALAGVLFEQHKLNNDATQIQQQIKKENIEAQRLAQIKLRFEERQKVHDEYESRVKVIDALRASQAGPVDLLATVSGTVNRTDEVWLARLADAGNAVNVDGVALSATAVANLMTNLMKTGYFKSVEIKETFQDEAEKKIQAFNFTLTCEKQASAKKS